MSSTSEATKSNILNKGKVGSVAFKADASNNFENMEEDEVGFCVKFVKNIFSDDEHAYFSYAVFGLDFKNRMALQKWQTIALELKEKIGRIEQIKVIDYKH